MSGDERGDQGPTVLRIRRRAFQGGFKLGVAAGIPFISFIIWINYYNVTAPGGPIAWGLLVFSCFTVGIICIGMFYELMNMRPLLVIVGPDKITLKITKKKRIEIIWGPDVHVDVYVDERLGKDYFGPLTGIGFYIPDDVGITVCAEDGWSIKDVWKLWRYTVPLIKPKGLKMDDDMIKYVRSRRNRLSSD